MRRSLNHRTADSPYYPRPNGRKASPREIRPCMDCQTPTSFSLKGSPKGEPRRCPGCKRCHDTDRKHEMYVAAKQERKATPLPEEVSILIARCLSAEHHTILTHCRIRCQQCGAGTIGLTCQACGAAR